MQAEAARRTLSFVVTGCSRSGTTYMARLLSAVGYECGHERVFNIFRVRDADDEAGVRLALAEPKRPGDSSFLAAPFLQQLPRGALVLHQLREPLEVIRSHMGIRFFADPHRPSMYLADNHEDFLDVIRRHCPSVLRQPSEIERCMDFWVRWNRLAQRAEGLPSVRYLRYRLEDVDARLLQTIVARLGGELDDRAAERALAGVSRSTNSRPRDDAVCWQRLPSGPLKDAVRELGVAYGYALD